jgi:hypothetical protein
MNIFKIAKSANLARHAALLASVVLMSACVAPVGPVEVTRFSVPEYRAELGQGPVSTVPAPGIDGRSLEYRSFEAAVRRELERVGYQPESLGQGMPAGNAVATISYARSIRPSNGERGPVSIGVGGGTGGYGSGVGVGLGFNLGGKSGDVVVTELRVNIRNASGMVIWEGRATSEARQGSPLAETQLSAAKLAESLFVDFPGTSGETILVE